MTPGNVWRFAPILACAVALGACNQSQQAANPADNTANSTATAHHDAREDIMHDWAAATKAMKGMLSDSANFNADDFRAAAKKLDQDAWAHFPAGSEGGDAKPEIWQNPTAWQQEIDKYQQAVAALNTAAQTATSPADVQAQFDNVSASCKSCHQQFREK